jgi:hypothetical protein
MTTNGNKIVQVNGMVVYNNHYDFSSPVKNDVRPLFMSPRPISRKKFIEPLKSVNQSPDDNWKWRENEGKRERDSESKYDQEELLNWCEKYLTDKNKNVL